MQIINTGLFFWRILQVGMGAPKVFAVARFLHAGYPSCH